MNKVKFAYVGIRWVSFLCIVVALATGFAGEQIAGPLLLTGFALLGLGAVFNVCVGFAYDRVYLGGREVAKYADLALFRLWLFLNVFLAFTIGVAAAFMIIVRYS